MEKFYINIDHYANMSSASIPVAMDEAVQKRKNQMRRQDHDDRFRRRAYMGCIPYRVDKEFINAFKIIAFK